jgi:hypothetical protein
MAQAPGTVHWSSKQHPWSQELPIVQVPPPLELELLVLPPDPLDVTVVVVVLPPEPAVVVACVSSTSEPQAAADPATAIPMKPTVSSN